MTKPMSEFTTDLQHSGMPAKDLDETIEFIPRNSVSSWRDCSITVKTVAHSCVTAI